MSCFCCKKRGPSRDCECFRGMICERCERCSLCCLCETNELLGLLELRDKKLRERVERERKRSISERDREADRWGVKVG